jgi:cell division protein FtsB
MTISYARPEQHIKRAIKILMIVLASSSIFLVYFYNQSNSSRRLVLSVKKQVEVLRTENAKLKNQAQSVLDYQSMNMPDFLILRFLYAKLQPAFLQRVLNA